MLLERDELLAMLRNQLDDAASGRGSMVFVAGEAGSGKTSLTNTFVDSIGDSTFRVIRGACDPLTTPRPLGPLHDFGADRSSNLGDLVSGDRPVMEIFEKVLDRLTSTSHPVVMVIEDVHWADEGTLDFLRFIGRRAGESKATVICTYRDDEVGSEHPLRPVLGQLIRLPSTIRLSVPALTLAAVTELAADHPVEPGALLQLTGGNAFYVTEVLASGPGLPPTVQEAVLARVSSLGGESRRVVEAVSVAPRSLDVAHASSLVGGSIDDVDAALAAGVLIADGRGLRFRHEVARSAVEDSMPPARRLHLHTRLLSLLEAESTPDIARLAHHAIRARDTERVARYGPAAGRDAASKGAHKEAVSFLEAALSGAEAIEDDETATLHLELADELGIVDRRHEALGHIDAAAKYYRRTGDDLALAEVLIPHTGARWRFEDAPRFRRGLAEAVEVLEPVGPSALLARAHLTSAYQHMLARRGRDAARDVAEADRVARDAGTDEHTWMITMLQGLIALVTGDVDDGVRLVEEVIAEADAAGNVADEVLALMMLGSGGGEVRRYATAIPALERGVDHGIGVDQDYLVSYCRAWLARIALEQGRWDDAVEYAELVERAAENRTGIGILTGLSALGRVRVRRGDPGGLNLLDEMGELARSHELQHGWNAICGQAEHHWLSGHPERGLEAIAAAHQRSLDTDSRWARGEIGFWAWRLGAIDQPPTDTAEPFALQMAGQWEAAAEAWRRIGCPYEVAMALADGDEAAKLEAVEILGVLGARPLGDRVRQKLRDSGVASVPRRPTAATLANPGGLTNRQLDVLRLIAEGQSNPQIASRLYLSKKTVEHHVAAIFTKLGVSSRSDAVAAAVDLGAVTDGL